MNYVAFRLDDKLKLFVFMLRCLALRMKLKTEKNGPHPGPSCSKHRYLNELVSGQNVNCSSKNNI